MSGKKRLDPNAIDVDSLDVEELESVAGGYTDNNKNCESCTCPAQPAEPANPVLIADRAEIS